MEPPLDTWHRFFNASLTKRLSPETFQKLVKACLLKTEAAPGRSLASALLAESRKTGLQQADPRVPLYINELLKLELCSAADVLISLLPAPPPPPPPPLLPPSSSSSLGGGGGGGGRDRDRDREEANIGRTTMMMMLPEMGVMKPSVEAMVLEALTVMVGEGLLKTSGDVLHLLRGCVFWMERFPGSMALGYLVSATLGSTLAGGVMGLPSMKGNFSFDFYFFFVSFSTTLGFFFFPPTNWDNYFSGGVFFSSFFLFPPLFFNLYFLSFERYMTIRRRVMMKESRFVG